MHACACQALHCVVKHSGTCSTTSPWSNETPQNRWDNCLLLMECVDDDGRGGGGTRFARRNGHVLTRASLCRVLSQQAILKQHRCTLGAAARHSIKLWHASPWGRSMHPCPSSASMALLGQPITNWHLLATPVHPKHVAARATTDITTHQQLCNCEAAEATHLGAGPNSFV
jgi:hypothetical protein